MRPVVSLASEAGSGATANSRNDAASVTASFVCADSIVDTSTWNASPIDSSAIFSIAGSSSERIATPSRFSVGATGSGGRRVGTGMRGHPENAERERRIRQRYTRAIGGMVLKFEI